jgi:hypothetical protein
MFLIWFSIIHHYLQDDVEKVAIDLLEYFAKYGYLLTRNRVQIFNNASIFGYKQTFGYKQKFLEKQSDCGGARGEVRYHVAAFYEVPFYCQPM